MSKSLKIFFVVFILLMIILSNFVQATSIDMNLTNTLTSNNISSNINQNISNTSNNFAENRNTNSLVPSNQQTTFESSTTSSLSNLPEANLGLSNILSIILIVIGVLLILLAIAILIRLKH